jgi:hypothetical protein
MSRLKLSSSATGTGDVTLTTPNTDTDYTISLPAVSGTLLVGGSNGGDVSFDGNLGLGITTPEKALHIVAATTEIGAPDGVFVEDSSSSSASPIIRVQGKRSDGNVSQSFTGGVALEKLLTTEKTGVDDHLGTIYFGGNHTNSSESNISYPASISAIASGDFNSVSDMPTDLVFYTGSVGTAIGTPNVTFGSESLRITSQGFLGIKQASPICPLDVWTSTNGQPLGAGTTMARFYNDVGGDLNQQKTFIDFAFEDDNTNEKPQVRIGAEVSDGSDAFTQTLEGCGAFVVYTNNATTEGTSATGLAERFRVGYDGKVGIGTQTPSANLHIYDDFATDNSWNDLAIFETNINGSTSDDIQILFSAYPSSTSVPNRRAAIQAQQQSGPSTPLPLILNDAGGNVGIGISAPTYPLHVAGAIYATGTITSYSDIADKENVETIENALDLVSSMRGVSYDRISTGEHQVGVIAQEMKEVLPEVVTEQGDAIGVSYGNIVGVLIEAIKELREEVETLKGNR